MQPVLQQFDRDLALADLLSIAEARGLAQALEQLLGSRVRIVDLKDRALAATDDRGDEAALVVIPLTLQLDTVGFLEAAGPMPRVQAAAKLVEHVLQAGARYCMAADLHLEAVRSDHERLQDEHNALIASETRLRELSENLEQRVNQQVKTIEDSQRSMYEAEKLAAVGQLAAGVAHEINNPVGFIRSNLNTARGYVKTLAGLDPLVQGDGGRAVVYWKAQQLTDLLQDFDDLLAESSSGADRVTKIVSDLKVFASMDNDDEDLLDLNDNLRVVCNVAKGQAPEGAAIEIELLALPLFKCQAGRINQVFLNLLLNALQAIKPGGEVRVTSAFVGGEILIAFKDNGAGIAADKLGRIFDPFFTTRAVGSGTGLGLTVTRDIVRGYGGILDIQSTLEVGTAVTVRLPLPSS